jgi:excisionase family DNA binding protein
MAASTRPSDEQHRRTTADRTPPATDHEPAATNHRSTHPPRTTEPEPRPAGRATQPTSVQPRAGRTDTMPMSCPGTSARHAGQSSGEDKSERRLTRSDADHGLHRAVTRRGTGEVTRAVLHATTAGPDRPSSRGSTRRFTRHGARARSRSFDAVRELSLATPLPPGPRGPDTAPPSTDPTADATGIRCDRSRAAPTPPTMSRPAKRTAFTEGQGERNGAPRTNGGIAMSTKSNSATMTVSQTAIVLGISRSSAYECVRDGSIPSIRLGRPIVIPRRAVDELLASATLDRPVTA